jgi:hypothetical protein
LTRPERLWTRREVIAKRCPVPRESGLYGWFFRSGRLPVPTNGCAAVGDWLFLYLGISPSRPVSPTGKPTRYTLRHRILFHMKRNAEGSTLRLSLGCLLADRLGIELRRVGSGSRMTFGPGEAALSNWLEENARITWTLHPRPWDVEPALIERLSLPLNLKGNESHPFRAELSAIRRRARERARSLPVMR